MKAKRNKKISVRKHLPLFVRVHYDTVRNFSPAKLFGLGIMMFIAVFGVLLATQTVSPSTSAQSANTQVNNIEQNGIRVQFDVGVLSSSVNVREVKYYAIDRAGRPGSIRLLFHVIYCL